MTMIKARIRIAPDGTLSGRVVGLPAGEHNAEISVLEGPAASPRRDVADLLARVRAIQAEMARLPVRDNRSPEEIIGYNECGHFD